MTADPGMHAEPSSSANASQSANEAGRGELKGTQPWLPWPFSGWAWWTRPVRAEGVAAMRIALAAFLLIDLLSFYRTSLPDIYGPESLGSPDFFDYYADAPRSYWSILRGFGDPLIGALALAAWLSTTCCLFLRAWGLLSVGQDSNPVPPPPAFAATSVSHVPPSTSDVATMPLSALVWAVASWVFVLGVWARMDAHADPEIAWLAPLGMLAVGGLLLSGEGWILRRGWPTRHWCWLAAGCAALALLAGLAWLLPPGTWDADWSHRLLGPWHNDADMPAVFFWLWVGSAFLLLIGLGSRAAAVATWALTLSFSHINPNIESAGDVIRTIVLFYLVLTPCGAVWSIDRWLEVRRTGKRGPVYVPAWPLRLMFVQMVLVYFMNGIYKAMGADWWQGDTLYYVLCDLTLSRVSFHLLQLPFWITQVLTWTVLIWEIGFPLWVALPWTRALALWFGVAFHLGIWATMELGGFVPYMMCMYLPLAAWERLWPAARKRD